MASRCHLHGKCQRASTCHTTEPAPRDAPPRPGPAAVLPSGPCHRTCLGIRAWQSLHAAQEKQSLTGTELPAPSLLRHCWERSGVTGVQIGHLPLQSFHGQSKRICPHGGSDGTEPKSSLGVRQGDACVRRSDVIPPSHPFSPKIQWL